MKESAMRLIDMHRHLWDTDWFPPGHRRRFAEHAALRRWPPRNAEEILPRVGQGVYDPDGSQMIADMEELGIDASVIMVMDWGMAYVMRGEEDSPASPWEINEQILSLRDKYPGKVYGFCGVDPRRKNAVSLFEHAVKEWGAVGLKVYPPQGYYANDALMYPLYRKATELNVPVLIHCGGSMFDLKSKWSGPEPIEEVAIDFPDLKVIMGHTNLQGRFESGSFWRGIQIGGGTTNLYLDFCDWQVTGALDERNIAEFWHVLDVARNTVGAHRMLWGTDLPMRGSGFELTRQWVDMFKNLRERGAEYGVNFTPEEVDLICHGNAERLLGIPPVPAVSGK
jgi:predicted TIM-barrel fold metal-dependent hydrolase